MISLDTKIKDMVKDGKIVNFTFYRAGNLYYKVEGEDGLEFAVPISDVGDASFVAQDKAILFMRYIRKHLMTQLAETIRHI